MTEYLTVAQLAHASGMPHSLIWRFGSKGAYGEPYKDPKFTADMYSLAMFRDVHGLTVTPKMAEAAKVACPARRKASGPPKRVVSKVTEIVCQILADITRKVSEPTVAQQHVEALARLGVKLGSEVRHAEER